MKFLFYLFMVNFLILGCETDVNPEKGRKTKFKEETKMNKLSQNNSLTTTNCFDEIKIVVEDSVLVYWVEVAKDSDLLANHAGNTRIVIHNNGELYYSHNSKSLDNLDKYFNTDLQLFKTLSATDLEKIKGALNDLGINELPTFVEESNVHVSGGNNKYLYTNFGDKVCVKFDPTAQVANDIKDILRKAQS